MKDKKLFDVRAIRLDTLMLLGNRNYGKSQYTYRTANDSQKKYYINITVPEGNGDVLHTQSEYIDQFWKLLWQEHAAAHTREETIAAFSAYQGNRYAVLKNRMLFVDTQPTRTEYAPPTARFYVENAVTGARERELQYEELNRDEVLEVLIRYGLTMTVEGTDTPIHMVAATRSASMTRTGKLLFVEERYARALAVRTTFGLQYYRKDEQRAPHLLPEEEQFPQNTADWDFTRTANFGWIPGENFAPYFSKWTAYNGLTLSDALPLPSLTLDHAAENVLILPDTILDDEALIWDITHSRSEEQQLARKFWRAPLDAGCYFTCANPDSVRAELKKESVVAVTPFDGCGLISPRWAELLRQDAQLTQNEATFQIRGPYMKGVLHAVDFAGFLQEKLRQGGSDGDYAEMEIVDAFGIPRKLAKVECILPVSMFKGWAWMKQAAAVCASPDNTHPDPMDYFQIWCRHCDWPLYLCRTTQPAQTERSFYADRPVPMTTLNYQVLRTGGLTTESYNLLIDRSMAHYHDYLSDEARQLEDLLEPVKDWQPNALPLLGREDADGTAADFGPDDYAEYSGAASELWMQKAMKLLAQTGHTPEDAVNPFHSHQAISLRRMKADRIVNAASRAYFPVEGEIRYLSSDLMAFLNALWMAARGTVGGLYQYEGTEELAGDAFYAAGLHPYSTSEVLGAAATKSLQSSTLAAILRNPHMDRSEQLLAIQRPCEEGSLRQRYLGHLTGVLMLPARSVNSQRLGGADFDGDLVRVITDPLYLRDLHTALKDSLAELQEENPELKNHLANAAPLCNLPVIQIPDFSKAIKVQRPEDSYLLKIQRNYITENVLNQTNYYSFKAASNSQVGRLSNIGFKVALLAYGDQTCAMKERRLAQCYARSLTIAVGLDIDSVKTGISPKLDGKLAKNVSVPENLPFLEYVQHGKAKVRESGRHLNDYFYSLKVRHADRKSWNTMDIAEKQQLIQKACGGCPLSYAVWSISEQCGGQQTIPPWRPEALIPLLLPEALHAPAASQTDALYVYAVSQIASAFRVSFRPANARVKVEYEDVLNSILFRQGVWEPDDRTAQRERLEVYADRLSDVAEDKALLRSLAEVCATDGYLEAESTARARLLRQAWQAGCAQLSLAPMDAAAEKALNDFAEMEYGVSGGGYAIPSLLLLQAYNLRNLTEEKQSAIQAPERAWQDLIALLGTPDKKAFEPLESLYTIFLCWMPQTMARWEKVNRVRAALRLLTETLYPEIADDRKACDDRLLWAALCVTAGKIPAGLDETDPESQPLLARFSSAAAKENSSESLLFEVLGEQFLDHYRAYLNTLTPASTHEQEAQ